MHEEQIQAIKDALRDTIQRFIATGRPMNNEALRLLTRAMEHAAIRISQLREEQAQEQEIDTELDETIIHNEQEVEEETQGAPPIPPDNVPPLDPAPHPSSNINAFRYDPESQRLYIRFQGDYPHDNGPVYQYEGVPQNIFNIIRRGSVAPRTSGSNAWHTWREGITPSHGASVYALIREGGFPYQRLS